MASPTAPISSPPKAHRGARAGAWARTGATCVAAGGCIALSVPPAGFWPLAIVGIVVWDRLLAGATVAQRARRSWLVAAVWLAPMTIWMWDLTAPGYVIASALFAGYFALAGAAVPPDAPGRWLALPGVIALAEAARWSFPWEGVPLATLAMGQADSPLSQPARLGGALVVSGLVVVCGVAVSAALSRRWRWSAAAAAVVVVTVLVAAVAPSGEPVGTLEVAAVQGGGPQRTRAATSDPGLVFARHLEASATDTFMTPSPSAMSRNPQMRSASRVADAEVSSWVTPTRQTTPTPMAPTVVPSTSTEADRTRWTTAFTAQTPS